MTPWTTWSTMDQVMACCLTPPNYHLKRCCQTISEVLRWSHDGNFAANTQDIQYIPRNMHTVFALLCFVVVIHWLIFPYPSGLLHWHCGNLTIAPVPAKQTSCEFIMNDCITTTKQSTTKPCAYFLGYTVYPWYQFKNYWLKTGVTSPARDQGPVSI